ncbi:MAG: VanZ family protein [Eubacteriales bacterium]
MKLNTLTYILCVIYLSLLTWLIIFKLQFTFPSIIEERAINLVPFIGSFGDNGIIRFSEITLNILVFIPAGIYISLLKTPWSFLKKIIIIIGLSLVYEFIQFIFKIGRADITDILSNTIGGIIGICIYLLMYKAFKDRTNKIINIFAAVFTSLVVLMVALLLVSHRWVIIK